MRDLPSGTVTLVFTDIEGSTRVLRELGERYDDALDAHRRILREAFVRHDGVEVDTQGDAFFVAFKRAEDAVAAVDEGQRKLANAPVKVRIGLHTGEPRVGREGYIGEDVHRAARICAVAHGGQVVVSERTRRALDDGWTFRDLGVHRLKDLQEPHRLFQLGGNEFPPLRSLNATNLPVQPSPLVGRARELAEVTTLVRDGARLLTLIGPGGTGKTRLALAAAAELVDDYADGVFWVPLAAIRDADLVVPTVEHTLGAMVPLPDHLAEKRALILLDNLEQVVECAPALAAVLARCPNVNLLVTSRAPLRIAAEREYRVQPLPEDDAVALFRERAVVAEPEDAVAEICRRVDGLPLAIELAAARTRLLPPSKLLDRLQQRLPLLAGGVRDAPDRQRTLRATIEWSYELLADEERELFSRLAVFTGGFTLEAAEDVCHARLDALESLVVNSLVRQESERFAMLETIREYALERLKATAGSAEIEARHADWFLGLAGRAHEDRVARTAMWLDRLEDEHENLRVALAYFSRTDSASEVRLASLLHHFWITRGYHSEGRRWLEEAARHAEGEERASALNRAADFASHQGEYRAARALAEESLAIRRIHGSAHTASSLNTLGVLAVFDSDFDRADSLYAESYALLQELGDEESLAGVAAHRANAALYAGDYKRAITYFTEQVSLYRRLGERRASVAALEGLAVAHIRLGRVAEARPLLVESVEVSHELGDNVYVASGLSALAAIELAEGNPRRAGHFYGAATKLLSELNAPLQPFKQRLHDETAAGVREELGDTSAEGAWAEGAELPIEDVIEAARVRESAQREPRRNRSGSRSM